MKEHNSIPVSKMQRAGKFITTGAKIGTNYLKHFGRKLVNPEADTALLHEDNARDIYNSLSELKGSALKVAQMLSMDKNLLPPAYQQQFAMAQYSVPPLSYPLVVQTFRASLGKSPDELFQAFTRKAVNAASMGQVHQAVWKNRKLAVKVQYPGVAESVRSDLAMVKPLALRMFNLNPAEYDEFIQEVEQRLLEETDYQLELRRSVELSKACRHIPNLVFPQYYPQLSSSRILTMDWLEGKPLGEALKQPLSPQTAQRIGQALWDFYHYQMHVLKAVHADPHPGNFILTPNDKLGVIDFGCVKEIPLDFYRVYFQLLDNDLLTDTKKRDRVFRELRFVYPDDSAYEKKFFTALFVELVEMLARPFREHRFNFADSAYFESLFALGERLAGMKELRQSKKVRGVRDALYINRTYFGLYNLLHELKAEVITRPTAIAAPA
jgi:predicted unusual protein kinase regulating ubiquinone biosynthesis (AarF/ABC1/UbiB family)